MINYTQRKFINIQNTKNLLTLIIYIDQNNIK